MELPGASALPDPLVAGLGRAIVLLAVVLVLVGAIAHVPEPAPPEALRCTGELRWSEACRALGPDDLAEAVDPPELARRLAANWEFGPENGLWRAGGAPLHLARRARWLRGDADPMHRARVAASLAGVLEAPASYGNWELEEGAAETVDAEAIAALYDAEADAAWDTHIAELQADWEAYRSAQAGVQAPFQALDGPLATLWLLLVGLGLLAGLERTRSTTPMEVRLDAHNLRLDGAELPLALIADVDARWGRLELLLRDGSRWTSRPLAPRNPARLELLLKAAVQPHAHALEERAARERAHGALAEVLDRVEG